MKKIFLLTMVLCIAVSAFGTAYAEEVAWNDVIPVEGDTWTAYKWKVDGTTLYLDYYGTNADGKTVVANYNTTNGDAMHFNNRPWKASAGTITDVVLQGTPDKIGEQQFRGMGKLKSVTFAGTEQSIGKEAFCNCTNLGPIFTVPAHITIVGLGAFNNTLTVSLIFEETTSQIQIYNLAYMPQLKNITLMRPIKNNQLGRTTIKDFCGMYNNGTYGMTNPAKINFLVTDESYFTPFANLTEYTDSYTSATDKMEMGLNVGKFDKCTVIDKGQTVQFATDVADGAAFNGSYGMSHLLYTENGAQTVEFLAHRTLAMNNFEAAEPGNADKLAKVVHDSLNTNLTSKDTIEKMVFSFGFTQLGHNFTLNNSTDKTQLYPNVKEVVLPATLLNVSGFAFYNMKKLAKVNLEDTAITAIFEGAFRYAPIKQVILPITLSTVYNDVFRDNPDLELVYIPVNNNTTIRPRTFGYKDGNAALNGKEVKVILDGDAFKMNMDKLDDGTGVSPIAFACQYNFDRGYRNVTVIYKSTAVITNSGSTGGTVATPVFTRNEKVTTANTATLAANKHYDVYDADNDGKPNLFMYSFAGAEQPYKLFAGVYSGNTLSKAEGLADGTAKAGLNNLINTEYDVTVGEGENAKVFLWDGFTNLTPLDGSLFVIE